MNLPEIKLSYSAKLPASQRPVVKSSRDAYELLKEIYSPDTIEHVEHFYVLCFNRAARLLGYKVISIGGIDSTVIDTRVILQTAILSNATSILITHNHPSGNVQPSHVDLKVTQKVKEACKLFDITLVDHIIMTAGGYYSFGDEAQL